MTTKIALSTIEHMAAKLGGRLVQFRNRKEYHQFRKDNPVMELPEAEFATYDSTRLERNWIWIPSYTILRDSFDYAAVVETELGFELKDPYKTNQTRKELLSVNFKPEAGLVFPFIDPALKPKFTGIRPDGTQHAVAPELISNKQTADLICVEVNDFLKQSGSSIRWTVVKLGTREGRLPFFFADIGEEEKFKIEEWGVYVLQMTHASSQVNVGQLLAVNFGKNFEVGQPWHWETTNEGWPVVKVEPITSFTGPLEPLPLPVGISKDYDLVVPPIGKPHFSQKQQEPQPLPEPSEKRVIEHLIDIGMTCSGIADDLRDAAKAITDLTRMTAETTAKLEQISMKLEQISLKLESQSTVLADHTRRLATLQTTITDVQNRADKIF